MADPTDRILKSARIEVAADHYENTPDTLMNIVEMLKDMLHTGGFTVTDAWVAFDFQEDPPASPESEGMVLLWKEHNEHLPKTPTTLGPAMPANVDEPAAEEEEELPKKTRYGRR